MKYRLNVSKGFYAVEWNDDVIVEAKNKDEVNKIALSMARNGSIKFDNSNYDDSDSFYQVESCEEFEWGMTQTESEISDLDKEGIFKLLSQMYEDYNRDNGSGISVGGYGFIYVEREFPHLTKKEINKTIDDWSRRNNGI